MKKARLGFLILSMIVLYGCGADNATQFQVSEKVSGPEVSLETAGGEKIISVEISDTSEERATGLMNRTGLAENAGMFFVFEDEKPVRFWMKNTLIPLDMIFFDEDYRVVKMQKNALPCEKDPCAVYPSEKPAKYVLEVPAGTCDRIGLKEGDKAVLSI
jgi:uncharacterized membrane protein (UPF0127 family)